MSENNLQKPNITVTEYNSDEIREYSTDSLETLKKDVKGVRWMYGLRTK
jgi:hypothetical protein